MTAVDVLVPVVAIVVALVVLGVLWLVRVPGDDER